jgi:hypothetical protein
MSNALDSFQQSYLLSSPGVGGKRTDGSSSVTGVPEVYGYNVIEDQDRDILNQGSITHIKTYFDKKQKEEDKHNGDIAHLHARYILERDRSYAVSDISFLIKFIIFIVLVWIVWDFVSIKKIE